ncbi:zinc finger WD40 repeat protein 1 [Rhynchospora pubera]|uniref:Zinc finger WD40 repeat protein 1 n=1 Tax=Rhynchospora pubera TaxID=906938 RepID=A0AAV8HU84_9POAL|nr:zinc finger WD40 repeat protein 1 [Rhynchospora pubera]
MVKKEICKYWQKGCCNRHLCPFLHGDGDGDGGEGRNVNVNPKPKPNVWVRDKEEKKETQSMCMVWRRNEEKEMERCPCPCKYFLVGKCKYGDRCRYLHAWSWSTDFSLLAPLHGHHKAITAILLPSASDELISSSEDGTLKFWNCHTGECISTRNFDSEIGCIMSDGPWLFVGLRNSIKVYNFENNTQFTLLGPAGLVYALAAHHDMLFAGTQAWDLTTLECVHTLSDHTDAVMSLLFWGQFLLSCSLDKTVKVWAKKDNGALEVIYTHTEEHGVLALQGTIDATGQSVLCCSVNDHTVRLYNLPSFERRGRIFAKKEVRALQTGPSALFFTGDGTGDLKVWKWSTDKGCNMQC